MDRRPARQTTLEQRALYSLPKVSKKKKVESKIIPSQEEVDRAIAAALAVQQTQFQTVLDNQKAHFENLLQQQPQNVLPPRPPITNHHIPIPKYDQESMTASYYLDEVETYFQSQGFGDNQRLYMINSIVETEVKSWLQHTKRQNPNLTWDEFKVKFAEKYDTWFHRHNRMNRLQNRRQKDDESIESYVWEIVRLSQQVYPTEPLEDTVRRCRQGLIPRLRASLGEITKYTPEYLIERCNIVWHDLQAQDRKDRVSTKRFGFEEHRNFSKHKQSSWQNSNRGPVSQTAPENKQSSSNEKPTRSAWRDQVHTTSGNKENVYRSKNGKEGSQGTVNFHSHLVCNKCKKKGHIARNCSYPTAIVAFENDYDDYRQSSRKEDDGREMEDLPQPLNEIRGARQ